MNTILITGARGLLGATLMRTLTRPDRTLIPLTADITDRDALLSEVRASGATHIVHTAALTDIGLCEHDPQRALAVNAEGTKHVVEAAREIDARVIYISSVAIFSGEQGNYAEHDAPQPMNVYSETKAKGEDHIAAYEKGTTIRLNLIGIHPAGSRGKNFLEWLLDSIQADKDLTLFSDVKMNPLSNWTIASLIGEIIDKGVTEKVLHIGSRDVVSKAEVGEMVLARFPSYAGTKTEASVDSIADGVPRPKEMWLNCDYTKRVLAREMPTMAAEIEIIFNHL